MYATARDAALEEAREQYSQALRIADETYDQALRDHAAAVTALKAQIEQGQLSYSDWGQGYQIAHDGLAKAAAAATAVAAETAAKLAAAQTKANETAEPAAVKPDVAAAGNQRVEKF